MDLTNNSNINFCQCGCKKSYSEEYDSYYCADCNKWLENTCNDPDCDFCQRRPNLPNKEL